MTTNLQRIRQMNSNELAEIKYTEKDIIGQKFGKLTVLNLDHKEQRYTKNGKRDGFKYFYLCKCDCGNEKIIIKDNIISGHTTSCGCKCKKHLLGDSRIYHIWHTMLRRCNDKNHDKYKNYGGKNIKVCQEWFEFEIFYNWAMNNGYNDALSIDRINVNGNYEPNNCRWITLKEQHRNKSTNVYVEFQGQTKTLIEWSELLNIPYSRLHSRLKRGWAIKDVFSKEKFVNKHIEQEVEE